MAVPHVTLREITPDLEPARPAVRVSPAQHVDSHGEVHLALDLTVGVRR